MFLSLVMPFCMNAHPSSRSTVFRSCVVIAADAADRSGASPERRRSEP
jgi:hypothetical protein